MIPLAARVLDRARVRGLTIATAESCTGGLVAGALTDIPGSSDVVDRGFVTYSNAAKREMLGVRAATLEAQGAVSEEVAREMALTPAGRPSAARCRRMRSAWTSAPTGRCEAASSLKRHSPLGMAFSIWNFVNRTPRAVQQEIRWT